MTNEEFQRLVLEKLDKLETRMDNLETGQSKLEVGQNKLETRMDNLETGQNKLETRMDNLETGQTKLEIGQKNLELGQKEIMEKLDAVIEQTADLTEFRHEVRDELADIKSNISRIEIATADNWSDIAKLKAVR